LLRQCLDSVWTIFFTLFHYVEKHWLGAFKGNFSNSRLVYYRGNIINTIHISTLIWYIKLAYIYIYIYNLLHKKWYLISRLDHILYVDNLLFINDDTNKLDWLIEMESHSVLWMKEWSYENKYGITRCGEYFILPQSKDFYISNKRLDILI
jgi:hypothetical protein